MKILHVLESYLPQVHGMSEVVRQISERLVEWGHDVTVGTSADPTRVSKTIKGVKVVEFNVSGNQVRGLWGETARYQEFLKSSDFDVITFFAAQQWATDLALPILGEIKARKVFVPTGFSGFYQKEYQDYFLSLRKSMLGFDASVFLSDDYRDINFAREIGAKNIILIPNGADEREFRGQGAGDLRQKWAIPEDEVLMLTVGSHTGKKGHREAIEILKNLKTPKNVTLFIVGNLPRTGVGLQRFINWGKRTAKWILRYQGGGECKDACVKAEKQVGRKYKNRRLIVRSLDRVSTLQAYHAADLFLFPSNIECSPVVLFEAAAAGTPFFSTDVGNSIEIAQWTQGGRILPTTKSDEGMSYALVPESADLVDSWLQNPSDLEKMGRAGQESWEKKFTWKGITEQYLNLYKQLTKN